MSQILCGKPIADLLAPKISKKVAELGAVTLATVGFSSPQWLQYVNSVKKSGKNLGIDVENILCDGASPEEFVKTIDDLNNRVEINGILVQQPLPKEFFGAVSLIARQKDVDCLSDASVADFYRGEQCIQPATPAAVLKLLDYYGIDLSGKNAVIIGRGNAVGKPLALMMTRRNATVTICHTKTKNLSAICRNADIIVSACGSIGLIDCGCVTENTVVVDVGLNFVDGETRGDVSPDAYDIVKAYSPVPGGVGPITRMTLFENLLVAATCHRDNNCRSFFGADNAKK